ncbi:MAG: hypothetical protein NVSMB38_25670 [Ktedonobacteraceae bacterium]
MSLSLEEAQEEVALVEKSNLIFALTHNYTGYPAIRQARDIVRRGEIGDVRKVLVEYLQDWLMKPLERTGSKQASWRTDPTKSGYTRVLFGLICSSLKRINSEAISFDSLPLAGEELYTQEKTSL